MKNCTCCGLKHWLLALAGLLLLLPNIGVDLGGFAAVVTDWWPVALLVYGGCGIVGCNSCKA